MLLNVPVISAVFVYILIIAIFGDMGKRRDQLNNRIKSIYSIGRHYDKNSNDDLNKPFMERFALPLSPFPAITQKR
jgi:hypothetical protein